VLVEVALVGPTLTTHQTTQRYGPLEYAETQKLRPSEETHMRVSYTFQAGLNLGWNKQYAMPLYRFPELSGQCMLQFASEFAKVERAFEASRKHRLASGVICAPGTGFGCSLDALR